jgi:hypothetical protein
MRYNASSVAEALQVGMVRGMAALAIFGRPLSFEALTLAFGFNSFYSHGM